MSETPDFDQIARRIGEETGAARLDEWEFGNFDRALALIVEELRQVWNAGMEDRVLLKHLKDENTAAHVALDAFAPLTEQITQRDGTGKQDITLGLAKRIEMMRRQVWNARCAIAAAEARVTRHHSEALARMEALGRAGLTVSVCCGPCGTAPFRWTVQVLSRDGQEFDQPFAAHTFPHAVEIAEQEIKKRGWLIPDA